MRVLQLGQTALHLAAIKGDKSTAECLLDAGANMLIEDKVCDCLQSYRHLATLSVLLMSRLTFVWAV